MKQVVHIIRKVDYEKQYVKGLQLEMDYELATLFDALQDEDVKQIELSKIRLSELHLELEAFHAFA
ncbi:hypothetical protein MKZ08_17635 [Viridibacillus sp. FSL R5-0477]|uniref:Uncharacterized protein n=2 Tax=Viridibacillus TaxID=496496 RepID=W4F076_9BACL|nr:MULTISPECIES: hypothetical protein [Viridibacillus]ETT85717.1 hypothetical protein C176_09812 [Viridibacillus arenosi FSL R5-213]KOO49418.1 hypothetical protein AMD00_13700 [Viridibacillus arvi]OMC88943.1 hypothetical protein BK128_03120 [Viridibacillus sp. FSL H7-0596]OMC93572.1 hypothetical protein BK137_03395 [Viridibacillus arenosi]QOV10686.1 hypothetical protein JNUCC6_19255 [Viridibacillus sp. JNUCC-6]